MTKKAKARPIRAPYTRERLTTHVNGPSMTQQHFADECDINKIMAKYQRDGLVTHVAKYQGKYDDYTVMPDFQTALNTMKEAEEMFLSIPSEIRREFENDPGKFVEFATDPENIDKMREMGLAPKTRDNMTVREKAVIDADATSASEPVPDPS